MEIWQEIALKNISDVLSQSGKSQAAFAKIAKVNVNHFNMVLNRKRSITRQLVSSIAEAVNKPTEWFYQDHAALPPSVDPAIIDAIERGAEKVLQKRNADHLSPTKKELIDFILGITDKEALSLLTYARTPAFTIHESDEDKSRAARRRK